MINKLYGNQSLTNEFDVAKHFLLGDMILFCFIRCEGAFSPVVNCEYTSTQNKYQYENSSSVAFLYIILYHFIYLNEMLFLCKGLRISFIHLSILIGVAHVLRFINIIRHTFCGFGSVFEFILALV